jgi:hypothetical protein
MLRTIQLSGHAFKDVLGHGIKQAAQTKLRARTAAEAALRV